MGFFFQDQVKPTPKKQGKKRNAEALNKFGCAVCPLNKSNNKSPKMQPTLAADTWIYWLGQNPGRQEDVDGRPFVGPSGSLLRYCLTDDILLHSSFDNVVRDRTPKIKTPEGREKDRDPTTTEIEACRSLIIASIEKAKPKLIVGLGLFTQQWALGSTDTAGMRGRVFTVKIGNHSCYFMPTYHPARVLHASSEEAKNKGRELTLKELVRTYYGRTFKLDVQKACKIVRTLNRPVIETEDDIRKEILTFNGNDWDQLIYQLNKAKKAPYKAIDIETQNLRPFSDGSAILSIAISFNNTNISFALDHPKTKWTLKQRYELQTILVAILTDDTIKIAHNAVFECEWFAHFFGKNVIRHEVWECTQLQAHFIDERRGAGQSDDENKRNAYQSLGFLVKMYFGVPFKQWFQLDKKNMVNAPLTEMLVYGGADTRFTLKLWYQQTEILRAQRLYVAYLEAVPRQPTVALMQLLGMPVNQAKVKELQTRLRDEISIIEAEIENLDVVKRYVKDTGGFNPLGEDAIALFRDYLKRSEIQVQDGQRLRWSIDKNVLEKIDHPLAELIVQLRNKTKMKSTYVDGLELNKGKYIYNNSILHCNFNTTFTTTGRLSSDEPNMQNFPSRSDAWVREQIQAPDGCTIIAIDYGQLEMCGAAMCSSDPVLKKALWDDYDTHMEWATKMARLCPANVGGDFTDPKVAKSYRSRIKNKLVFPAIYGAANKSMAGYLNIDAHYVDTLMDEFWDTFAGIKRWQKELLEGYRVNGYVETPTGRRRHHPLTSNEAINAPIQGLASDIVVDTMCQLSYKAVTEGKWYLHPRLNIHDDITFIVPLRNLDQTIEIVYKTMLSPNLGTIINVPLSVTVSVGKDWYHRDEVGKFWSHRDV
jgi:uracil-DNA glycosylase family 4